MARKWYHGEIFPAERLTSTVSINPITKQEVHRVAVISDTHGILRPEVIDIVKTCEIILHGGDIGGSEIMDQLNAINQTYAVRGNADKEWAEGLPNELDMKLFGFRIYMVHNKKHIREDLSGVDIIIYGHSHKYEEKSNGNITFLNPGSCGPRRFRQSVTMMVLTLDSVIHQFKTEKIDCFPLESLSAHVLKEEMLELPVKDMDKLVRDIMKEVDAGRNVADIAARKHVDEILVEQICRIYVTHPGVDVDGILDRMERKNL